jgi:hypothetical protein
MKSAQAFGLNYVGSDPSYLGSSDFKTPTRGSRHADRHWTGPEERAGYAFDAWSLEKGFRRGYTYRHEDAHYAHKFEIKRRHEGPTQ